MAIRCRNIRASFYQFPHYQKIANNRRYVQCHVAAQCKALPYQFSMYGTAPPFNTKIAA
jgi:hypothetical protein